MSEKFASQGEGVGKTNDGGVSGATPARTAPRVPVSACSPAAPRTPAQAPTKRSRAPTGRRTYQQQIGTLAEDIAAEFLRAQGFEILERNYLRRLGELDIVARKGNMLVIAEVRTRASNRFGGAAASVDFRKQRRLIRAAEQLLQQHRNLANLAVRFDVMVVSNPGHSPRVEWIQHAFLT